VGRGHDLLMTVLLAYLDETYASNSPTIFTRDLSACWGEAILGSPIDFGGRAARNLYQTVMSAPAHPFARHAFANPHRRQAVIILVITLVMARSAPLCHLKGLSDAASFKQWRVERRMKREERKRLETETPLSAVFLACRRWSSRMRDSTDSQM